ncbi:glycoside hydrolase family 3 protein [Saccharopolyspora sp. K220]|uniref:glycoside hydrolase family 3 protein n=1 Tax=Saccharopolyspora soli TaxID=2926618 RepID=UPI001F57F51C|nr:glycoside hydrolase family 3 N-terminal domain-containing protein [Saccharopolyspora soli]MCI2417000.1 glycoside hydrolase family 3 protein [Saccharopolyspora soli]
MNDLSRLAHGVLFPALGRTTVTRWAKERIEAGLGGFVLFGKDISSGEQLRELTAALHGLGDHVLLAIDEEGGDVNRLEDHGGTSVPGNHALGRLGDPDRTRQAALQIGLSLVEAGIDWDLAPAVDTAVNPMSPNGIRCFGSDRALVSEHAAAWVEGLQEAGASACAKHFPGHGLSGTDAHLGTPTVALSRAELLDHYLDPFRSAIAAGVDSIMVSHVRLPEIDEVPATISAAVLTGILRGELGFDGVVITDALEMHGIRDVAGLPEAAVRAIAAGADALCLGAWAYNEDVDAAVSALVGAVRDGTLSEQRLAEANERIARLGNRPKSTASHDDSVGRQLAEDVVVVHGDPVLRGKRALVIRLDPTHSPAAGKASWGVEQPLRDAGVDLEVVAVNGSTYNGDGMVRAELGQYLDECGPDADVVVLTRSSHRFDWQRPILDRLRERHPQAVIVDMGVPGDDFSGFRGWIQTFGAARVCSQAATHRLLGTRGFSR